MLLEKKKKNTFVAENAENTEGEMLEWLKRHAWKACIRQKRIRGSNPRLSAERAGQKWSANGQKATNQ
jgi:hypothetical protein